MRSILVATDLTPDSDRTLLTAWRIAERAGAAVHVVYPMGLVGLSLREAAGPLNGGVIDRARGALRDQLVRTAGSGMEAASYILDYREPSRAVAARSAQVAAELVMVGNGASGREIARLAALPVLVVQGCPDWPPARVVLATETAPLVDVARRLGELGVAVGGIVPVGGSDPGAGGAAETLVVAEAEHPPEGWQGPVLLLPAEELRGGATAAPERAAVTPPTAELPLP